MVKCTINHYSFEPFESNLSTKITLVGHPVIPSDLRPEREERDWRGGDDTSWPSSTTLCVFIEDTIRDLTVFAEVTVGKSPIKCRKTNRLFCRPIKDNGFLNMTGH